MNMLSHKIFTSGLIRDLAPIISEIKLENPKCRIRAQNDIEALERFLEEYFDKPTTYRTYKKECERFLVWCIVQQKISLENFDREHVNIYINFLRDPKPKEQWCGPKGGRSNNKQWRPFVGPLSENGIKTALTILNSFLGYLVEANYIHSNPFALIRRKSRFKTNLSERELIIHERILEPTEWDMLCQTLFELETLSIVENKKKQRLIILISLFYYLGLRVDELARARWNSFRKINNQWWFFVIGKGDKLAKIPVNSHLVHDIIIYRSSQNFSPLPSSNDDTPVIAKINNLNHGVSTRQIHNLLKDLAQQTILKFELTGTCKDKFLKFSPHWLRHLSASHQDQVGISFTNIKANLRHESEQTTRQYVHAREDLRHQEMEKLKLTRQKI